MIWAMGFDALSSHNDIYNDIKIKVLFVNDTVMSNFKRALLKYLQIKIKE